ncbi:hypothetical protein [Cnuella takakiae]|nr:hypothetical protein [Cnuella takakiae]
MAFWRSGKGWLEGAGSTAGRKGRDAVRSFADRRKLQFGNATCLPVPCG